jgi:hypothetical protein
MRGCMVLLTIALAALAQESVVAPNAEPLATVPPGTPLRVAMERRVAIKRVGEPIQGRLVDPVFVFDRVVLPAGSLVKGHIAEIGGIPTRRRLRAILSGNFTPPRDVRAQFDALVLSDGLRLSIRTSLSRGTSHIIRVAKERKSQWEPNRPAIRGFSAPGRMSQLKSTLLGMLPYHRQAWPAGTRFEGVLQEPLTAPLPGPVEARTGKAAVTQPEAQEVNARLLTPISSATARKGAPVEAAVTRPVFSTDHELLIPEGSRLFGNVVEAQPARRFHRNGKVLLVFHQIKLPVGTVQRIQGYLEGVEADFNAHLALDSEGAARAQSPKTRFIFPVIASAVAGLSLHQDYNSQGIPDQDIAGRAESGAVGLGLIGTLLAQTSRTLASSIAFAGAGFSVYSNFIARGEDVILPENTPVIVSLRTRGGEAAASPRSTKPADSNGLILPLIRATNPARTAGGTK